MWQQHATGKRDQHVVEIFAMDADDNRQNVENETSVSDTESTDGMRASTHNPDSDFHHMEPATRREDTINPAVAP